MSRKVGFVTASKDDTSENAHIVASGGLQDIGVP